MNCNLFSTGEHSDVSSVGLDRPDAAPVRAVKGERMWPSGSRKQDIRDLATSIPHTLLSLVYPLSVLLIRS